VQDRRIFLDPYNTISIADENGDQVLASYPISKPRNFRSSENFQFHSRHDTPELFISKPRRGMTSGKWSMFLSHRVNRKDGSFGGDVALALDAEYFSRFYDQIDLGRDSVVTLVGRDGIVRARKSNQESVPGQDMSATRLFTAQLPSADHGCYTTGTQLDGISRILCYRAVKDFSLVVSVGVSEAVALAHYRQRRTVYLWWAGVVTVVILLFTALVIFQIARQRRSDSALRESEERFQRAITASAVGIWDWDVAGKHYNLSPQYKALLGVHSAGWKFSLDEFRERLHPADRKRALAAIPRHIEEDSRFSEAFRLRCGDGCYRWFHVRGQASWDSEGRAAGFAGSVADITESKKITEARAVLAAIVDGSNDAIISRDLDRRVLSWNAAAERLFGYTAAEVVGRDISFLIPPDREQEAEHNRALLAQGRAVLDLETVRLTKAGRRIPVSLSQSPITDEQGTMMGVSLIFRDISERKQAEQMRGRLAAIVENSTDAIVSRALDGTILSWNAAAERLFGYSASEVIGQPIAIILPPDKYSDAERNSEVLLGGGQVSPTDVVRLTKDGRLIDVIYSISPIKSEAGEIVGAAIIFRDISERKQAEDARARLATIVENSNDAIIGRTIEGTITSWNAAAERMFGCAASEAIGQTVALLWDGEGDNRGRATVFATNNERLRRGESILPYEARRLTRDGRAIVTLTSISPIKDEAGGIVGAAVIIRDITERKQAEAQQQLAASVFDSAAEGIIITDADNKIISVNRAFTEITGYEAAEAIGKNPRILSSGAQGQAFYDEMWSAVKTTGCWQGEIWDKRKNGKRYCELLSITAVRNTDGRIIQHCAIFMDITNRKQAEADLARLNDELETRVVQRTRELERTNQELDAFSYSVSHDLRVPLRAIQGFSAIVLKANEDKFDPGTINNLKRIQAGTERMGQLIEDLLRLSRVSRHEMRRQDVDLSQLSNEVLGALAAASPQRKVRVTVRPDMRVNADRSLMRIMLENLLGNAWKFTGKTAAAQIEIGSTVVDGETVYFVRDNGVGFSMEYAHKLFGAFQRLHHATEFEGTGIGLATVQRIVNLHGGRVWANSVSGEGATFFIVLRASA
jgi:PAS domain S-box-containing protein